jgi:DNA-binding beta-propeller fold protein YncE
LKRIMVIALALFSATAFAQQAPEIPFESVPNFLKLPENMYLGEVAGIAINSKKHIFIFNRGNTVGPAYAAAAAQLLEFGPDGKFIREIGHGLYAWAYAHTVRIDKYDNIWATDKGSDMIIKFSPEGRVLMVFGRKKEASDVGATGWSRVKPPRPAVDGQFREPTDVTWDMEDNIFISDGYVNSRVAKYDKNGDWVKSWGEYGTGPSQFDTVHSIAADAKGNIYVADRSNVRVQVFDHDGNRLREIKIDQPFPAEWLPWFGAKPGPDSNGSMRPGAPWAICINPGSTQYLYVADAFPGRIYKVTLDGKVVGMIGKSGRQMKQFGWIHELACPSENEIYAGELLNWRAQKLILKPTGPAMTQNAGDQQVARGSK